jgi:hypothetical protein
MPNPNQKLDDVIMLPDATVAFCNRHRELFRAAWPKGFAVANTLLFQEVLKHETFMAKFEPDAEGRRTLEPGKTTRVLLELSPLCCLVGDAAMQLIVAAALDAPREH